MIIENNMKIKTRGIQVNFDEYILNVKIPLMIVIAIILRMTMIIMKTTGISRISIIIKS